MRESEDTNTLPIKPKKVPSPARTHAKTDVGPQREDAYGYRIGSDMSIVIDELVQGGVDKHSVAERIAKRFEGQRTRNGKPKAVSTIMNQAITQLSTRGFRVVSSWKLELPEGGAIPPRPRVSRAAKKAARATEPADPKSPLVQGGQKPHRRSGRTVKPKPRVHVK